MDNPQSKYQKLIHSYICVTVIISCMILMVMGVCAAKNNSDALESGIKPAMIYAARNDEEISVKIDKSVYTSDSIKRVPAEFLLSLAPTPAGNIYLIYKNVRNVINDYFIK